MLWVGRHDEVIYGVFWNIDFPLHGAADLVDCLRLEVVDEGSVLFGGEGAGGGQGGQRVASGVGRLVSASLFARVVVGAFVGCEATGSKERSLVLVKAKAITGNFGALTDEIAVQEG